MSHVNEGAFKSIFYLVMIALYDKTAARRSHPAPPWRIPLMVHQPYSEAV